MGNLLGGTVFRVVSALILSVAFGVSQTHAATVTDAYAQPSDQAVAQPSNHTFVITIATGFDDGETLTLTFPSAFGTTSLDEDDVDIADDGVEKTTASNCSGTEQISVGISSNVITFTACAGDGGSIAAGSVITIEIGVHAATSGTGIHRIANPSNAATYFIALSGTFGDTASFPIAIVSSDDGSVSATVPEEASSGGGGGGGAEPSDTTDPDPADPVDPGPTDPVDPAVPVDPTDPGEGDTPTDSGTGTGTDDSTSPTPDTGSGSGSGTGSVGTDEPVAGDSGSGGTAISINTGLSTPGGISLLIDDGVVQVLPGTSAVLTVRVENGSISSVQAVIGADVYALSPVTDGVFAGNLALPAGSSSMVIELSDASGVVATETYTIDEAIGGRVYEIVDGVRLPVQGAVVTIYEVIGGSRVAWDGTSYGVANPFVVGADGSLSLYVPNGTYVVHAGKSGYVDGQSATVTVRNHILSADVQLVREPDPIVTDPDDSVPNPDPHIPEEPRGSGVLGVAVTAVTSFRDALADVREIPEVQVAAQIAAPTSVVLAGTSAVVLATSFNLLPFLQYLITSPVLFLARRRRKAFGTVYNAATKLPIDLAIVRIFAMPERRLVRTVVTDQHGQYLLTLAPGRYALEAAKPQFIFPSVLLAGHKDDGQFLDLYTGQEIVVTEDDASIAANIPLDPEGNVELQSARALAVKRFMRVFQHTVAVLGIVLAAGVAVLTATVFSWVMVGVQVLVYFLVRRLAHAHKPKGWGIVYDETTKLPVGNAVVRLFEPTYNKLIETVLTDRLGRYAFLVGPNEYYLTFAKPGYAEKIVKPLDYRAQGEPSAVAVDVGIAVATEGV